MVPFPELLWPFTQLPAAYTVLDTETTGFPDEQGAPGIISVGVCFVSDGAYQDGAEFLTRPHRPLEDQAAEVNGFDKEEVKKYPEFADQWPDIVPWLEGQVVVMHNAAFDWPILLDHLNRYKLTLPPTAGTFCSLRGAHAWAQAAGIATYDHGPSLNRLTEVLGVESQRALNQDRHAALIDARQTATVVERLCSLAIAS